MTTPITNTAREVAVKIVANTSDDSFGRRGTYEQFMDEQAAIIESAITTALNQRAESAVDEFISLLFTALSSHGIDATNWDGDDPPHVIIANGIATALNQQREEAEKRIKAADKLAEAADEAHGYIIEIFQRVGSSTTDDELERKLSVAIVEYARAAQEGGK